MTDEFFDTICRVGIFVICAKSIVHFRPRGDYEKYLKLLVSAMVLIQIFIPVGSLIFGGGGREVSDALNSFKEELQRSVDDVRDDAKEADEMLEEMTLEEVRKRALESSQNVQDEGCTEKETEPIGVEVKPITPIEVGR